MFFTYLIRELAKRKKQTILVSSGLALAVALVVLTTSVTSGIKTAQDQALSGLYGIGTDISVSKTAQFSEPGARFEVGSGEGSTDGETRSFSQSRLETSRASGTLTADEVAAVAGVDGVTTSVATLKLESVTFNGELPTFVQGQQPSQGEQPGQATEGDSAPTGGTDGKGGAAFDVTRFSVEGVAFDSFELGPLAAVAVDSGRMFVAEDAGKFYAVLDAGYAASEELAVGDTIEMGSEEFTIIGVVSSTATSATTPSNVYIPLDVAQTVSGNEAVYSNIYVAAESSQNLDSIKTAIETAVPDATASTAEDLASTVSGSLATASSLAKDMGGWLSAIVLLAAFGSAILFTTSGVNRRIREFGTLKAIGWRTRRVVGQVVGESLVSGVIGGVFGLLLGLGGVAAINAWGPTLSASIASAGFGPGGMRGPGGMPGEQTEAAASQIALQAQLDPTMLIAALGFALLGGLLAGAFGGLRAAKLSPVNAFRSID